MMKLYTKIFWDCPSLPNSPTPLLGTQILREVTLDMQMKAITSGIPKKMALQPYEPSTVQYTFLLIKPPLILVSMIVAKSTA
jgi:hypothetical protein